MDSDDSAIRAYRWIVSGRVQGVGFRWFVLRAARQTGATGWVRNLWDGRVEVMGQGTVSILHDLEMALEKGPMMSIVENVEKTEVTSEVSTFKSFEIN
jgi:acylphosphatase